MCVNKKVEELKLRIEKERIRLNQMMKERKVDETYRQSLVVDELIAEYISLINE